MLYHGRARWHASTDLAELMLAPPEGLEQFQPQQKYMLIDQHRNKIADHSSNVVALLFKLLRSQSDAEMRAVLKMLSARMRSTEMKLARDSIERWIQTTLQDAFPETKLKYEEGAMRIFGGKFRKYEDLLEYEAVQRGYAQGLRIAIEVMLQASTSGGGDQTPPEVAERLATADVPQLKRWMKSLARGSKPRSLFAHG